jgi:hypothetical protein
MENNANANRLSKTSQGEFHYMDWIKEGVGLYDSARSVRTTWLLKKRRFNRSGKPILSMEGLRFLSQLTALPRSSMLLLGYSVEMFLKSGIAKLFVGSSESIFKHSIKNTYSHNLERMAIDLQFNPTKQDILDLRKLQEYVLAEARYPVSLKPDEDYTEKLNNQNRTFQDRTEFSRLCELALRIKRHILTIDSTSSDPMSHGSWAVDDDGYFCYRIGGTLNGRITYRLSAYQKKHDLTSIDDVKEFACYWQPAVAVFWNKCDVFEELVSSSGKAQLLKRASRIEK